MKLTISIFHLPLNWVSIWSHLAPVPAVDLSLQLPVHLLQLDAVPQLRVQQLLAEPLPAVLQAQETRVVHSGVIVTSEPVIKSCNSSKVNQNCQPTEKGIEVYKEPRKEKI